MSTEASDAETAYDESLARVMEYRGRGRSRPTLARIALAALGVVALIASIPLSVVLPEIGIPALLVALRLLAVEVDWAARAYAWIDWRFGQTRAWFHRQSGPTRLAVIVALLAVAAGLVWLLIHEFL